MAPPVQATEDQDRVFFGDRDEPRPLDALRVDQVIVSEQQIVSLPPDSWFVQGLSPGSPPGRLALVVDEVGSTVCVVENRPLLRPSRVLGRYRGLLDFCRKAFEFLSWLLLWGRELLVHVMLQS